MKSEGDEDGPEDDELEEDGYVKSPAKSKKPKDTAGHSDQD